MPLPAIRPDILLSLCEAIEDSPLGGMVIGRTVTSNKFIRPILRYMTAEWKKVKELIVDMIVGMASKSTSKTESIVLIEAEFGGVFFKPEDVEAIRANMDHIMGQYKAGVLGQLSTHMASARASTVPIVKIGTSKLTSVALSREGVQEIVDNFTFQKDFVDKLTLDTVTRVERLTASRYTSLTDLRSNLNREFRIDRDRGIQSFRNTTDKLANRVRSGRLSSGDFQIQMSKDIEDHYRKLYRAGKGSSLEAWEEEFVRRQAQGQIKYLDNFANYIEVQKGVGNELTSRINQRTSLYAERGSAIYEAGFVASLPDDVLIDWVLQPAEHCPTCPIYASNSPYTKGTLPGFPGEGFHITICGTNCKCKLRISDLFVIELPGEEEIPDLPITVLLPIEDRLEAEIGYKPRVTRLGTTKQLSPSRGIGEKTFHQVQLDGGTIVNLSDDITPAHRDLAVARVVQSMDLIPMEDRFGVGSVFVYSDKFPGTLKNQSGAWGSVVRGSNRIDIWNADANIADTRIIGVITHETGHVKAGSLFGNADPSLASFPSSTSTQLEAARDFTDTLTKAQRKEAEAQLKLNPGLSKEGAENFIKTKTVSSHYASGRPAEEYAESYAKYYTIGKVTRAGDGGYLKGLSNFFKSTHGIPTGRGKKEWLLNEQHISPVPDVFAEIRNNPDRFRSERRDIDLGGYGIVWYRKSANEFVAEAFFLGD